MCGGGAGQIIREAKVAGGLEALMRGCGGQTRFAGGGVRRVISNPPQPRASAKLVEGAT